MRVLAAGQRATVGIVLMRALGAAGSEAGIAVQQPLLGL